MKKLALVLGLCLSVSAYADGLAGRLAFDYGQCAQGQSISACNEVLSLQSEAHPDLSPATQACFKRCQKANSMSGGGGGATGIAGCYAACIVDPNS